MLALTLETAKQLAIAVVVIFVVGAFLAAWMMKTIVQKLATVFVLGLLAFAVFTQRTSLQDCADKVQGNFERIGMDVTVTDTDCSFFGATITVKDPRLDEDAA
ncbi:MAG: putative membrane protein YfcA [Candidatus Azotimanducaceae bacterium]